MPVPSYRVPVKIARGTYANLLANVASLEEGEIVYANDENALYVVEGGVLTKSSADLGISSIGDLGDVDTSTTAPTDGQALVWNNANSEWEPGTVAGATPDLDAVTTAGATTSNDIAVGDLLTVQGDGASQDGRLRLNCSANTHAVTIQSPPHSDAATYSLILPSSAGTAGQVLTSQAGAQLTWETPSLVGSIDDLSDVDTTTAAPTTGQVLEWDGTNWVPATVSSGGVSGIGVATRASDSGTAASSALTLTGLGSSGQLHTLSTDLDAWVVFYGSAADRTADAGRAYNTDPAAGSGVLAEAYVTTAGAILFTPGTGYMNNDTTETAALYLAVRDQAGAAVNATLTVTAYVQGGYDGISGGTFGSG